MPQKKLMLLGGLRYLIPVIKAAHEQGYYVITADYLPDNIAHKYSDEYCNVSIIDKEAVLEAARKLHIDGIMSFACDPGVIAASYVQNQLGLPSFGPFESVEILQNKDKFRAFLAKHDFNVPWAYSYDSKEDAWASRDKFSYPLIVKPTDSAGSKGCSRVDAECDLLNAIEYAFRFSIKGRIIIEEFLEKRGCSSDSDSYVQDGQLRFISFNAQHFDENAANPYTPAAFSWPSTFTPAEEEYLTSEIQRLITLLGMKTAVFNIETRISTNGKLYIMELTPRGGGNRLCEMIRYATGVDMITAITRAMVGDEPEVIEQRPYVGHWAEVILHADKDGEFAGLQIDPSLPAEVVEEDLWVKPGDKVHGFEAANDAIGTLALRFENAGELERVITNISSWLKILMKKLLILGGKPIGSVEIVTRAKELGYYTIVTDYLSKDDSPAKRVADESWEISTAEVETLAKRCVDNHIDGVITGVHEFNISRMLELCELIHKPCYCKKDTWIYCGNKIEFKKLCTQNSIPVAKKYDISDIDTLPYPVITKPVDGSGSRGFHICQNPNELIEAYPDAQNYSPGKIVLIEDYIPYNAVIIHYTMDNGRCIYSGMSDKISVRFKSTGSSVMGIQTFPSKGEDYYLKNLNERVCKMFENAGFTDGPIWIESFFNGIDKFVFNEMGYRFGGSLTYYPVYYFHQINQLDTLIKNAIGERNDTVVDKGRIDNRKYCILPIHIKAGEVCKVIGENIIKSRNDVYAYVPVHFVGDKIQDWGSAQQVFCYLHILYHTKEDLRHSIQEILDVLKAENRETDNMLFTLFDLESL